MDPATRRGKPEQGPIDMAQRPFNNPVTAFKAQMFAFGLQPPDDVRPGALHRFPGIGKGPTNRAGWCWLSSDAQGGAFGCWASGLSETWQTERRHFTSPERAALRRQMAEAKQQAQRERDYAWQQAAARAREIWRKTEPANPEHPYLFTKAVAPFCARQSGPHLVLPIVGWDGHLSSLQFIGPEGDKKMLKGGRKRGRLIPVHGQRGAGRILIAEGFATAATLADAESEALTIAALDAYNLKPVALEARSRYPGTEIVIAADADAAGIAKARAAAIAAGALIAAPEFPPGAEGSDWNDLAALQREEGAS